LDVEQIQDRLKLVNRKKFRDNFMDKIKFRPESVNSNSISSREKILLNKEKSNSLMQDNLNIRNMAKSDRKTNFLLNQNSTKTRNNSKKQSHITVDKVSHPLIIKNKCKLPIIKPKRGEIPKIYIPPQDDLKSEF